MVKRPVGGGAAPGPRTTGMERSYTPPAVAGSAATGRRGGGGVDRRAGGPVAEFTDWSKAEMLDRQAYTLTDSPSWAGRRCTADREHPEVEGLPLGSTQGVWDARIRGDAGGSGDWRHGVRAPRPAGRSEGAAMADGGRRPAHRTATQPASDGATATRQRTRRARRSPPR